MRTLLLAFLVSLPAVVNAMPRERIQLEFALQAPNREQALRELKRWAEDEGGYLFALSDAAITVRIPAGTESRLDSVEKKVLSLGALMTRSISRTDHSEQIAGLDLAIRVKEKHLADLQKLAADAGLRQTLTLEQELRKVQDELEKLKGRRRMLVESTRFIDLRVTFSYRPPVNPAGEPDFGWVNEADLYDLMKKVGQ